MRTDRKNRVGILLLAWILSVFVLFDLYTLSANSSAQVSACSGTSVKKKRFPHLYGVGSFRSELSLLLMT